MKKLRSLGLIIAGMAIHAWLWEPLKDLWSNISWILSIITMSIPSFVFGMIVALLIILLISIVIAKRKNYEHEEEEAEEITQPKKRSYDNKYDQYR